MNTARIIYEQVKALPEPVVTEILDFVEFVRGKAISPLTNGPTAVDAASDWPKIVLDYHGDPGLTPFEAGRNGLLPPNEVCCKQSSHFPRFTEGYQ